MTKEYFINLYQTVGPRNFQLIFDQFPCLERESTNQILIELVTMEEILAAGHQLETVKALGSEGLNDLFYQY